MDAVNDIYFVLDCYAIAVKLHRSCKKSACIGQPLVGIRLHTAHAGIASIDNCTAVFLPMKPEWSRIV